jgi:FkbM family methyltransferase
MNNKQKEFLKSFKIAEIRLVQYAAAPGSFLEKKLRRLLQLHYKFVFTFLCRLINVEIPRTVKLFWGLQIVVPCNDVAITNLYYFGTLSRKERPLIKYLIKHLKSTDVFYDIGANYAFYTHLCHEFVSDGECHAFEPNERVFKYVAKNLCATPCVYVNNEALSNKNGALTFYKEKANGSSGTGTLNAEVVRKWSKEHDEVTVRCTTLDTYISSHRIPTVMKLDVEGAELQVLEGAVNLLEKYTPDIAMEVWSGDRGSRHSSPAVEFLLRLGYSPFSLTEDGDLVPLTTVDTSLIEASLQNFIFKKIRN